MHAWAEPRRRRSCGRRSPPTVQADTPACQTPAAEPPAEWSPTTENPPRKSPAGEVPREQGAANGFLVRAALADQAPAGQALAARSPAGDVAMAEAPAGVPPRIPRGVPAQMPAEVPAAGKVSAQEMAPPGVPEVMLPQKDAGAEIPGRAAPGHRSRSAPLSASVPSQERLPTQPEWSPAHPERPTGQGRCCRWSRSSLNRPYRRSTDSANSQEAPKKPSSPARAL